MSEQLCLHPDGGSHARRPLGVGEVGVHRPFLFAADRDQDFEQAYQEARSELEAYFDEMRVSSSLLDLMYSVPPGEMRILSRDEIELFLPFMDPVYEEKRVTVSAQSYGISNFEYRSRENTARKCFAIIAETALEELDEDPELNPFGEWENCKEAILWGLTLEEYLLRKALPRKACLDGVLDRSALRISAWTERQGLPDLRHAARRIEDGRAPDGWTGEPIPNPQQRLSAPV